MASSQQIEECFTTLDKEKKGYLTNQQIPMAIRALGKNPNEKEMKELLESVGNEKVDLAKFKTLFNRCKGRAPDEQDREMRNAFQALDVNGSGFIHEPELRQILGNLGDALTSQEVNSLMREAKVDERGMVDYSAFVDMLVNAYPVGDYLGNKR